MDKIVIAVVTAAMLAACGGATSSDPDARESDDSTAVDETEAAAVDEDCGLTEAQIDDDTMAVVGSYFIDGDALLCSPTAGATDAFAAFTTLIPAEYREGVVGFVAIEQEASDGTDGAMQDVIGSDGEPTGERYLALDVTGSSEEIERTIVHEVGHTIFVNAGSDRETNYAVDFNTAFPPGESYRDVPEDFVSEYAASDETGHEDMAESWAMFVYGDTPFAGDADDDGELDVVEPDTLAAEKVAFWSVYPELVELRNTILSNSGF